MRRNRLFPAILLAVLLVPAVGNEIASAAETVRPGINLAGPCDWNTELPFVDVFRLSRTWISQQEGKPWGQGPALELDEHGWVKRLPPNVWAETLLCTIEGGHYPSGAYTLRYDGQGEIRFNGAARSIRREGNRMLVDVDSSKGAIFLQIRQTDPNNYNRNIRFIMPGFENQTEQNPWHPVFLDRWRSMQVIRFMDFMQTNNSKVTAWIDRPKPDDATWSEGVPIESMCDLANRLQADPWFCMPHRADDDFVRRFARQVKEQLDPKRKIFIEYSNEVWNGMFEQNRYAAEQGQRLKLAEKPWEAAWKYHGLRSKQIFAIWEEVFGGTDRLVRVIAGQAANPYVVQQSLLTDEAYRSCDAIGIAPYVSMNIQSDQAEEVLRLEVEGILDRLEEQSLPESIRWIEDHKKLADEYHLRLVAYEAGQHLVGIQGAENNDRLTELFHAANRHPRMGRLYRDYYDAWQRAGGGTLCVFSSISRWSKWGSWGLMQYYDDRPQDYPKFEATIEWAGRYQK